MHPALVTPFSINGTSVAPGSRRYLELAIPEAYGHASLSMPVVVCHGRRPGPALFVSAAIHGDEIIGTEIIRRLLDRVRRRRLRGTLVAVPVVNAYGFLFKERYLPDRRDLNRSFPGTSEGSLAARLAQLFMREIVARCDAGIDLHSAAAHRENLPQVRASFADDSAQRLAEAFAVPVILKAGLRDGSLREAAGAVGKPVIVYEAGEALRLDEAAVRVGVSGCLGVLGAMGIIGPRKRRIAAAPLWAPNSIWLRAPASGLMRPAVALGAKVEPGQILARIADPTGRHECELAADDAGIVIGRLNLPLVNEGDAIVHLARFGQATDQVAGHIEEFDAAIERIIDSDPEVIV